MFAGGKTVDGQMSKIPDQCYEVCSEECKDSEEMVVAEVEKTEALSALRGIIYTNFVPITNLSNHKLSFRKFVVDENIGDKVTTRALLPGIRSKLLSDPAFRQAIKTLFGHDSNPPQKAAPLGDDDIEGDVNVKK